MASFCVSNSSRRGVTMPAALLLYVIIRPPHARIKFLKAFFLLDKISSGLRKMMNAGSRDHPCRYTENNRNDNVLHIETTSQGNYVICRFEPVRHAKDKQNQRASKRMAGRTV